MKDLDELKRETDAELRAARERRVERQARERHDGPILAAYDRMAAGLPLEYQPEPRHAPKLTAVTEISFEDIDESGEAGA
jgi:hypothetical protein